jgi:tetratricopeptide (TPR) repeat protein/DNA polymerase III delta prime subunit
VNYAQLIPACDAGGLRAWCFGSVPVADQAVQSNERDPEDGSEREPSGTPRRARSADAAGAAAGRGDGGVSPDGAGAAQAAGAAGRLGPGGPASHGAGAGVRAAGAGAGRGDGGLAPDAAGSVQAAGAAGHPVTGGPAPAAGSAAPGTAGAPGTPGAKPAAPGPGARKPGPSRPPAAEPPTPTPTPGPVDGGPPADLVTALPPAPEGFLGRRDEMKVLRAEIRRPGLGGKAARAAAGGKDGGVRVLLVAGHPGTGRTALALKFAHELAGEYPDGAFFVRFPAPGGTAGEQDGQDGQDGQAERSDDPVLARIARDLLAAVGQHPHPSTGTPGLTEAARQAFAGRRALLVFDDVPDAARLLPLLPDAPQGLVLATAAGPLTGVPDVRPCVLGGLDRAAGVAMLTELAGSTRIVCDPRAAEEAAEACGHGPAALRLIGGWLATKPEIAVAEALTRMRDLAAAAEDRSPTAPLHRAFRLVHDDLPPVPARMLRLLALAPAGLVDPHVAAALAGCATRVAARTLADFAGQGLLAPVEPAGRYGGEDEYQVPGCLAKLLRELVAEKERPNEVQLARARMLERTVRLLGSCRLALDHRRPHPTQPQMADLPRELRFASRPAAARWLHRRLPVLLAAARAAVDDGGLDTLARRLIAAVMQALALPDGRAPGALFALYQLHGLVLDVALRRGLHREQAAALINLADLDAASGRRHEALERYREALAAARTGEDEDAAARAMESLADTHVSLGDPVRAADWYGRALAVWESRGVLPEQARLHGLLGHTCVRMRRWPEAAREWRAGAALYRRAGEVTAYAQALTELARVLEYAGYPEECLRTCREALRWARHGADTRLEAAVQLRMADTLDRLGDPEGARIQRAEAERLLAP